MEEGWGVETPIGKFQLDFFVLFLKPSLRIKLINFYSNWMSKVISLQIEQKSEAIISWIVSKTVLFSPNGFSEPIKGFKKVTMRLFYLSWMDWCRAIYGLFSWYGAQTAHFNVSTDILFNLVSLFLFLFLSSVKLILSKWPNKGSV